MATQESDYVFDYGLEFLGGQDASKAPDRIAQNAFAAGVNLTTKNGVIGPRSGFKRQKLDFSDTGEFTLATKQKRRFEEIFSSGKFQAVIPYSIGNDFYQIIVIAGIIFLFNQNTLQVSIIEIEDGSRLNEGAARINWSDAGRFKVLYDFPARPVIIDGVTARRSDPKKNEVPISRLGAYNQNRLFIANGGNEFTAGDPTGSLAAPDAPVTFLEVLTLASPFFGEIFQLPTSDVTLPISAMTFLQTTDTSTGIGPLLIATKKSIFSYNSQNPRTAWKTSPFGSLFTFSAGIAGARAFVNVNSDLFFISSDGQLRSASMSRDEQKRWARVPLSREVQNWIKFFDPTLVQFASMGYFNNRLFMTVNPYRTPARTTEGGATVDFAHGGIATITMDNISNLSNQSPPVWDGLWTGVRPMDFCLNDDRFFIISKDEAFVNRIYEVTPETMYDQAGKRKRLPTAILYTREYNFQNPFQNKEPHSIDLVLGELKGKVDVKVELKPSQSPKFLPWRTFSHEAPAETCEIPSDLEVNGFASQEFKEINLGQPEGSDECDPITLSFYRLFRELQLRFIIRGDNWELRQFRIKAVQIPQSEQDVVCGPFPAVRLPLECSPDWKYEEFPA